jgi:hypothetical protein
MLLDSNIGKVYFKMVSKESYHVLSLWYSSTIYMYPDVAIELSVLGAHEFSRQLFSVDLHVVDAT